jgi:hypothetical protein
VRDRPSIIEFVTDPQLLGLSVSPAQRALLKAIYGLALDADEGDLWRRCTGREAYPSRAFGEVTVVSGARAGKDSRIAAPIACYEATFGGHDAHLAKGEHAIIPLVAQDKRGTRTAGGYVRHYFTGSPLLRAMLAEEPLADEVRLTNRTTVMAFPCTLRSLRGFSIPAAVMDELGFYRIEGAADADAEIQASIRRGMLAFPAARLVKVSTPYMKAGVLYDDVRRAWGQADPDLLVWRAPTVLMNPAVSPDRLERERRLDPSRFAREYEAEFADDLEAFLPGAWIDGAVAAGRHELPPVDRACYYAGIDPSGGGPDAFTLAVVHPEVATEGTVRVVHDVMRSWGRSRGAGVDLEGIVRECAEVLGRYGVHDVLGDRYAGQWVRQAFERYGIAYHEAPDKAAVYGELEPLVAQGRVVLLDHPIVIRELKLLERRPRPGGRPMIDHPRGAHDDHANALALAAAQAYAAATTRVDEEEDIATILAREVSGNFLDAMDEEIERANRVRRFERGF